MNDRVTPHSIEGEMGVIGSVLADPTVLDEVRGLLPTPNAFFDTRRQIAWKMILELADVGKPLDAVVLKDHAIARGVYDEMGGLAHLSEMLDSVPSAANARWYAGQVHRAWQKRRAIIIGRKLADDSYEAGCEPYESTAKAMTDLEDVLGSQPSRGMTAVEAIRDFREWTAQGNAGHIPTGYSALDFKAGGIPVGEMTVVAARTGVGKTTFCLAICRRIAETGVGVCYVSLEMPIRQLAPKLIAQVTGENQFCVRANRLSEGRMVAAMDAADEAYSEYGAWLHFEDGIDDVDAICAKLRWYQRKHAVAVACVDYLQILNGRSGKPYERATALSMTLKRFAQQSGLGLIVAVQCNRAAEGRNDKRPTTADLRDSGRIEEDAGMVLLLHRPGLHDAEVADDQLEIHVAKNRLGATANITMRFLPDSAQLPVAEESQPTTIPF